MNIYNARQFLRTKSIYDLELRVVYYARVSTDKEEQKNSIVNQRDYFEEFIRSNSNWKFVGGYIDDGISGIHAEKREEFQRMISDAMRGKFDLIITKEISRFARNTLDSIQYTRQLLSYGVCVWFRNDNINTIDDDSEFRLTIMAGVAQDEIRKLSSRVKFGHAQAIKNGVVLGNSRLYGYNKEHGRLTINEKEAPMVRLIFEKYATGEWSTPRLEKLLYDMGYRNYKGGRINRSVIQHIIANPKYKGYYAGGKVKIVDMFTKKQQFLPEEEWNMYKDDGSHVPAIVDEETWEAANKHLKARGDAIKERRTSFKSEENIFTGVIFCENDGSPYWQKRRHLRGRKSVSWSCSYRLKNKAESCPSFPVAEDEILAMTVDLIRAAAVDIDEVVDSYLELYKKHALEVKDHSDEIRRLEEEEKKMKARIDKILDYNLSGSISDQEFLKRNEEYQKQLGIIQHKLKELSSQSNEEEDIDTRLKRVASSIRNYADIQIHDITRSIILELFDKITIKPTGERKATFTFYLNNGETVKTPYNHEVCSDDIFKKMIEEQEKKMAGK